MAEVAGLARAAETGDRTREAHDRHDLAPRAHSRVPAGTWRVADHLNLEAEPRTRVEHPNENGNRDCLALATAQKRPIYVTNSLFEQVEDMSEVLDKINENGEESE